MTFETTDRMGRREVLAMALLAAVAAACGGAGGASRVLVAQGVRREKPKGVATGDVVRGVTAFGHALYEATATPAGNTVLSPLSIAYAFAMARAGATGGPASELDKVFGFPASGPHAAFNALTGQIVTTDGPPPAQGRGTERDGQGSESAEPVVRIANGLFAQEGTPVKQDFLRTLASQYGAGVRTVDFVGGGAADAINAWADEETAGRIDKLFDRLDVRTRLVIANAVYLKADWAQPFADESPEEGATFTRADGSTVRTTLMRRSTVLRYTSGPGWQAVELPYAKSDLAMWVLVPDRNTPPTGASTPEPRSSPDGRAVPMEGSSLAGLLAPDTLVSVAAGLATTSVKIALPRWDFATDLDLEPPLRRLGLKALFAGAELPEIADGIVLDQAVHRANITVDEWGTEAAAVTGMAFAVSAPAPPTAEIRADHPFAFAIMHTPTSTPLFIGHVADPTR